ncbi:MAG: polysaccharide biosynthesis protein [Clostridia bacterium]|nr:polysaccharide biosynthesis protein [Clostridia bacterium]
MRKISGRSFVLGAAILSFAGIICKVIGVLFRVWANNIIGEAGMAYYEVVFPFYSWLLILSSSGIPIAISKMVAERVAVGDYADGRKVFRKSLLLLSIVGIVTTAVLFFGADFFTVYVIGLDVSASVIFKVLAPALFFVSMLCAYRGYLQGLQLMSGTGVSQIAEQVFKCVFGLSLAAYFMQKTGQPLDGACGALLGIAISEAIALIIMMLFKFAHRRDCMPLDADRQAKDKRPVLRTMLKIAIPITLGASILPITSIIDVSMIYSIMKGVNVDQAYVALSTYVRSIINLPASVTVALAMSLVPAISASVARKDEEGVRRASRMGVKLSMFIGLPCAVGLFVLGAPIVEMLFRNVSDDTLKIVERIFMVASFTVIFISLVQTATGALQGIGKHRIPVYCLLIGAAAKIVVNLVLLPMESVNIVAASWSNVACYGIAGILDVIFLAKHTKMRLSVWKIFLKPLIASLVMGLFVYFAYDVLYAIRAGTMMTLVCVILGVAVYIAMSFVLRVFDADELQYIPFLRKFGKGRTK